VGVAVLTAIGQYVAALRIRQRQVALAHGLYLQGTQFEIRMALAVMNATVAVVVKLLVDKGVVTDAEVTAAFDAAMAAPLGNEPTQPDPGPEPPGPTGPGDPPPPPAPPPPS
jgi:hypothetical protein